jgi:hypothetical protein
MNFSERVVWFAIATILIGARIAGAQGTLHVAGKDYKLEHVVAYETKFFDDKAISVP